MGDLYQIHLEGLRTKISQRYEKDIDHSMGTTRQQLNTAYINAQRDVLNALTKCNFYDTQTLTQQLEGQSTRLKMILLSMKDYLREFAKPVLLSGDPSSQAYREHFPYLRSLEYQINAVELLLLEIHQAIPLLHMEPSLLPDRILKASALRHIFSFYLNRDLYRENNITATRLRQSKTFSRYEMRIRYGVDVHRDNNTLRWCPITTTLWKKNNHRTAHIIPPIFGAQAVAHMFGFTGNVGLTPIFDPGNTLPMCRALWHMFNDFKVVVIPTARNDSGEYTFRFVVLCEDLFSQSFIADDGTEIKLRDLDSKELIWRSNGRPHAHHLVARWLISLDIHKYTVRLYRQPVFGSPNILSFDSGDVRTRYYYRERCPTIGKYLNPAFLRG